MIDKTISAKVPAKTDDDGKVISNEASATVIVQYTEDIDEAVEMFGEEALLTNAFRNWAVTLQSNIRTSLKAGMSEEAIIEKLAAAKMGIAQVGARIDPQAAFIAKFKNATPEGQADMIELLKAAAAGE